MRKCIALIIAALLSATAFSAELLEADVAPDLMMKIWPGDAPDLGPVLRQETPWPNFAHVSSPELWVYLPETPATNRPAMVIFPGGSLIGVAMELHVYNVVKLFNDQGIAVIGVKYRTDYGDNDVVKDSLADCERAIRQVRYHAAEWGIDPNQICAQGYSAGSTVCMNLLGNYDDGDPTSSDPVERFSSRPDRVALMCPWPNGQSATTYPMSTNPPPVFLASAEDDTAVPLAFVQDIGATLIRQGGRVEWFIVPTGGHFALHYGVSTGPGAEWPAAFKKIFPIIKKVYVMLLGGQSNAMGLGYQRYLEETTNRLASPQTDIDMYVGSNTGNLPVNTILPLQSGSGDSRAAPFVPVYPEGTNAPVNRFGPELGMARTVRDRIAIPDSKVAIIKYAFGATRLYDHWRPDGTADSSGDGSFYQGFQSTVASGLVALHAKYPDHEIELLGMGWVQGESDILMGKAGDYQANLTTFVEDIRATYGTNMVFVLSKISPNQEPNNLADEYWFSDLDVLRNAQQAVADADPLVNATETIGPVYSVYPRHVDKGAIHFDSSAMLQIGEDLGTALMTLVNLNADRRQ